MSEANYHSTIEIAINMKKAPILVNKPVFLSNLDLSVLEIRKTVIYKIQYD